MNGNLMQISFDGSRVCGVAPANSIWCADDNPNGALNWRQVPGGLKWISVWGDFLWGVNANDDVFVGRSSGDPLWRQLQGKLKQISSDSKQICGANSANEAWCADECIFTAPKWRMLPMKLKQLALINVRCTASAPTTRSGSRQLPGNFRQLDIEGGRIFGVNGDTVNYHKWLTPPPRS
ncbi:hypothetical protein Poli38472_014061 [Pythium oligandrum]|uniref:Lectin n=1 Tax=Pythium oligandrum TaxID=41045 RepID=A0A8K1FMY0_PYTOL|nr:hypothetical protein Poli38472_014061 [Pythium oligandrum]|eukprot:TMW66749.1 hypothetical protein Poli38472_014061 [Pythium oligandrum]